MNYKFVNWALYIIVLATLCGCEPDSSPNPDPELLLHEPSLQTVTNTNDYTPEDTEQIPQKPVISEPNQAIDKNIDPIVALNEPNEFDNTLVITTFDNETITKKKVSESNEPNAVKPEPSEPNIVESNLEDALQTEPNLPEPNTLQPKIAEPNTLEPNLPATTVISLIKGCEEILSEFVGTQGKVDYSTLRRKRLMLKKLLDRLEQLDPNDYNQWPQKAKTAFWINVYNVHMLKVVADNYPISSKRLLHIFPGWGPGSVRYIEKQIAQYKFYVMDEEFTFSEIKSRFFDKQLNEPRVFFAITYNSISAPQLRNKPYYPDKLDEYLDQQVRRFLFKQGGFQIDRQQRIVYLSAILQPSWHGKHFIGKFGTDKKFKDQPPTTRAVLNFISNYLPSPDITFLERSSYSVRYRSYDWSLNDGSLPR